MTGRSAGKHMAKRLCGAVDSLGRGVTNSILLTFDDGPDPEVTSRVLSLLEQHHARAVFFVVGARIPRAPHLLREILEQGHALGNHSFSHPNDRPMRPLAYLADLRRCQRAIAELAGAAPRLFRPPLGRLSSGSVSASRLLGLKTLLWSVDTGDWRLRETEAARLRATELVQRFSSTPIHNDIVLMHDDNPRVTDVLERLLPALRGLGADLSSPLDAFVS